MKPPNARERRKKREKNCTRGEMLAQGPKPSHPADPGRLHGQKPCALQRAGEWKSRQWPSQAGAGHLQAFQETKQHGERPRRTCQPQNAPRILRQCMHLRQGWQKAPSYLYLQAIFFLELEVRAQVTSETHTLVN